METEFLPTKTYLLIVPLFDSRSIQDTYTDSEGTSSRFQLAIGASVSESTIEYIIGPIKGVRVDKQALRHFLFSHDL